MTDLFNSAATQITFNPGLLVALAAAIGLLIVSGRQYLVTGTPRLTVDAASTISIGATVSFAILMSLQTIAAGSAA